MDIKDIKAAANGLIAKGMTLSDEGARPVFCSELSWQKGISDLLKELESAAPAKQERALKPCPFCGGMNLQTGTRSGIPYVDCKTCHISVDFWNNSSFGNDRTFSLYQRWNKRSQESSVRPQPEVEEFILPDPGRAIRDIAMVDVQGFHIAMVDVKGFHEFLHVIAPAFPGLSAFLKKADVEGKGITIEVRTPDVILRMRKG